MIRARKLLTEVCYHTKNKLQLLQISKIYDSTGPPTWYKKPYFGGVGPWTISVTVDPRVSLHPGPHCAIEGSSYTLPSCHVTGYPALVVWWGKSSGPLPQERLKYNNSALQILHVRKDDSDRYYCVASNLLGHFENKIFLVVVSPPRFSVKEPAKAVSISLFAGFLEKETSLETLIVIFEKVSPKGFFLTEYEEFRNFRFDRKFS